MIVEKKSRKPVIDLDGREGNAFNLLGMAGRFASDLEVDGKAIQAEMMAGNYAHLVRTFCKYFGPYITLETSNQHLLAELLEEEDGQVLPDME